MATVFAALSTFKPTEFMNSYHLVSLKTDASCMQGFFQPERTENKHQDEQRCVTVCVQCFSQPECTVCGVPVPF